MANSKRKSTFFDEEEGLKIKQALVEMATNVNYNTESSYSANALLYPDHLIPFVEKHINYLLTHPSTDPQHYISNLRLMTRIRR